MSEKEIFEAVEKDILITMLNDDDAVDEAINLGLKPKHFQNENHRKVFVGILEQEKSAVNFPKLLKSNPDVQELIKTLYSAKTNQLDLDDEIFDLMAFSFKCDIYHSIVNSEHLCRNFECRGRTREEILDGILKPIENLMFDDSTDSSLYTFSERSDEYLQQIESDFENKEIAGILTGKKTLDDITGGFMPGRLYVIGARPSHGKTTMGCIFALNAALAKKHSLFITMEMSETEIRDKMVAHLGQVSYTDLTTRQLDNMNMDLLMYGTRKSHLETMHCIDLKSGSFEDLVRKIRIQHGRKKLDVVFIDYLSLLSVNSKKFQSRRLEISHITMALKQLSKQLKIPIVLMSQLNREAVGLPEMSQLKESGSIEQDADIVFLLYKGSDDKPGQTAKESTPYLIVAKNRIGKTGYVELDYSGLHTSTIR